MASSAGDWELGESYESAGGRVAYGVFGSGEPVVLVHGTPSNSYLWRGVVERLASGYRVYVYDLLGYGASEQREGEDVSIGAQTEVLVELLAHWGLREPAVAGHDIGAAIVLRAHLLRGVAFSRVALIDAVCSVPWITPFSRHVQRYLEAFSTMPGYVHREVVSAHLRSAIYGEMNDDDLWSYLEPWTGEVGQEAYYRHVSQFDERYTDEVEPLYGAVRAPTLIAWGEEDAWIEPSVGERLHSTIPGSVLKTIRKAGHFAPEDAPAEVAAALGDFFAAGERETSRKPGGSL